MIDEGNVQQLPGLDEALRQRAILAAGCGSTESRGGSARTGSARGYPSRQ
jgi:hypothetical protein